MRPLTLISLFPLGLILANPVPELAKRNPASVTYNVGSLNIQNAIPPFLSLDKNIFFTFQGDGNFVAYVGPSDAGNPLWSSGTGGNDCDHNPCSLNFQGDGNLVVYINNQPKWSSKTPGHTNALLVFHNVAPYIAVYNSDKSKRLWSSGTSPPSGSGNPGSGDGRCARRVKRGAEGVEGLERRVAPLCPWDGIMIHWDAVKSARFQARIVREHVMRDIVKIHFDILGNDEKKKKRKQFLRRKTSSIKFCRLQKKPVVQVLFST